jgi:hypothetical protein
MRRELADTDLTSSFTKWSATFGTSDSATACASGATKLTLAETSGATWTAGTTGSDLCAKLSMTVASQASDKAAKTFTVQGIYTPTASADEATAVALLKTFKTNVAKVRGGINYNDDSGAAN